MDVYEVLNKLQKVKRQKHNDWLARCPAHRDKNPSLGVTLKDGKILLKCWAGCSSESVVSSLGMQMKDLFEEPAYVPSNPIDRTQPVRVKPKPVNLDVPYSAEAEQTVLGLIMLDNSQAWEAEALLTADDFHFPSHRAVFGVELELAHENVEITPVTVADRLGSRLKEIGGISYLTELTGDLPPIGGIVPYVRILKDKSVKRGFIKLADAIKVAATESDARELLSVVESKADELRESLGGDKDGFRPVIEVAAEVHQDIQDIRDGKNPAIATGLGALDIQLRGGGYPGELHVLVAKTSKGKSAAMKQFAQNIATRGVPVGIITAEMTDKAVFKRMLAPVSGVPAWRFQPECPPAKLDALEEAIPAVAALPIFIDDQTTNIYELRARVKSLVRRYGVRVLFVDYLQLLSVRTEKNFSSMSRTEEVAFVSRALKKLAKELDIWIMALAQFNRSANAKDNEGKDVELDISQIAESGAIEKDADVVLILDMDKFVIGQPDRNAKIRIGKNRDAISDLTIELTFNGDWMILRERNSPLVLNRKDKQTKEMFEQPVEDDEHQIDNDPAF